jgi:transposase
MPKILTLKDHLTKKQLQRKYLSCQHSQEKKRWQALSLMADGKVASAVATELGMSANWMSKTVHRYNEGGVAGVKNKSKNQDSKTLTADQVKALDGEIESGKTADERLWSATQIKRWVGERTGTKIHRTTAWRMFAKLNYTRQVPRPAHEERASETEQAEFKKS